MYLRYMLHLIHNLDKNCTYVGARFKVNEVQIS